MSSICECHFWASEAETRSPGSGWGGGGQGLGGTRDYSKCSNYLSKQKLQCKKEEKTQETDE